MTLLFLFVLLLNACTLVNQELPNESPTLESSTISTNQIRRGGSVRLEILAADEDDDPLFFTWLSIRLSSAVADTAGNGTFLTPDASSTTWVAPNQIEGESEDFLITVTVRDRVCAIIEDHEERSNCEQESFELVESFNVEVVQRPPVLQAPADTAVSFREPFIALDAQVSDLDGDPLEITWSQLEGPELILQPQRTTEGSQLQFVPLFTGDFRFQVSASDGSDTVSADFIVSLFPDPMTPAGGMVSLALSSGEDYEIDVYEYPNQKGEFPLLVASWFEAFRLCAAQGKRLCSRAEWTYACQDGEERRYASTDDPQSFAGQPFGRRFCNSSGSEVADENPDPASHTAASGSFPNCAGENGVYDLTGNLREWVAYISAPEVWVGGFNISGVQDIPAADCGVFVTLVPLPVGFAVTAPDSEMGLEAQYDGYKPEEGMGFRCCR